MEYTQSQWLLFFFAYSFLGWVWETLYVSVKKRHLVNRGFLYGPWLPIYGFGAIIILFLTLPVRDNLLLVYLLGMAGATALEYITGAVMEKLFHVRYWDYSSQPLNVQGHICLGVSLAWGVFALFLVHILHPPVEDFIEIIPLWLSDLLSILLLVAFVWDVSKSVEAALRLKGILMDLKALKEKIDLKEKLDLKKRLELPEKEAQKLEEWRSQWRDSLDRLREGLDKVKKRGLDRRERELRRVMSLLNRNPSATSRRYKEIFQEFLPRRRDEKKPSEKDSEGSGNN